MEESVSSSDSVLRLNYGVFYTEMVAEDLFRAAHLEKAVTTGNDDIRAILKERPGSFIEGQMDTFDEKAFSVWFPFQKGVAIQMSHIRAVERENFITPEILAEHRGKLEPGDLLLQRRNWQMTNVGIPGFWPHVAIFIGTPEELNEYFKDLPGLKGEPAFERIRAKYPGVARAWESRDEGGYVHSVIEALRDGIVLTSLEESGSADYLAALRPKVSKKEKFKAVLAALSHYGKPYDYNFDFATDNELVCTELVYRSYEKVRGLKFEPRIVNGRCVLPPNDLAVKFAEEHGSDDQQLELALFLDGNEEKQTVAVSDATEFAKTAGRPKWDVLLE
jgi:hypothetical protein